MKILTFPVYIVGEVQGYPLRHDTLSLRSGVMKPLLGSTR